MPMCKSIAGAFRVGGRPTTNRGAHLTIFPGARRPREPQKRADRLRVECECFDDTTGEHHLEASVRGIDEQRCLAGGRRWRGQTVEQGQSLDWQIAGQIAVVSHVRAVVDAHSMG